MSAGPGTVPELLLARARRRPAAVAVRQWDDRLTYADLVAIAAELATTLTAGGAGPEVPVGLCMRRTPRLAAAVLGVLLTGATCVPLDAEMPGPRLEDVLDGARVGLLVVDEARGGPAGRTGRRLVEVPPGAAAAHVPTSRALPDGAAFMLHTSGSTGRPKAVVITHRGVVAYLAAMAALTGAGEKDRFLGFASLSFDVSVEDLLLAPSVGGALQLVPEADRGDPARLQRFAEAHGVSWGCLPVSLLPLLDPGRLPEWRVLLTGGEPPGPEQVERWTAGGRRFINC